MNKLIPITRVSGLRSLSVDRSGVSKSPQFFGDDPTPDVNLVSGLGQYVCGLDTSFFHALTIPRDQTYTKPHTPYRSENRTICTTGLRVDAFAPKAGRFFFWRFWFHFAIPFIPFLLHSLLLLIVASFFNSLVWCGVIPISLCIAHC